MLCGAALTFATAATLLAAILLAPAVIAAVSERNPAKPITRAVTRMGLTFSAAPVWHVVQGGNSIAASLDCLADPAVLATAWLAGACGWALCEMLPVLLTGASEWRAAAAMAKLTAELEAEKREWGLDED